MNIGDLVPDVLDDRVRDIDEMARRHRIEEMLAAESAVAKMKAKLDIIRHRIADADEPSRYVLPRGVHQWKLVLRLPVPDDHVVADIPLDAEIAVRDVLADQFDFARH